MANYVFKETQRFTQWWIWIILISVLVIVTFGFVTESSGGWSDFLGLAITFLVITLFLTMELNTRIDASGLTFSFFPFIRKRHFAIREIQKLELIEYNSLLRFGGWGIRYNLDMWAYNVGGRYGLIVHLKNRRFLVGTRRPQEMQKAINQFNELNTQNHGG
jgi:hypothetical protein